MPIKSVGGVHLDIAALAMSMKQAELMQNVSLTVTKTSNGISENQAEQVVEVSDAPHPTLGQTIDVSSINNIDIQCNSSEFW